MPKVAIILVNYNGRKYLPDCLSSLAGLDYPKDNYKIFFVDNLSTDDSLSYAKTNFPDINYIEAGENLGFAAGNNLGMSRAMAENFDYVFLINQDTICNQDVLTKLVNLAEKDDKLAAIQPRLMLHPETDKINSLGNSLHYLGFGFSSGGYQKFDNNLQPKEIAYATGAAVLIKKEVLKKIGLFPADFFMYHEDMDLGWRMRLAGYKIMVDPGAVVYHKYEFSKSIKKYYFMERNRFICLLENYKLGTLLLILPALIFMEMGLFAFSLRSGFWGEKLKVYAWFLHLNNWKRVIRGRREKRQLRVAKDKDIVKFFTGKIEFQEIDNWALKYIANPVFNAYWQVVKYLIRW